MSILNMTDRERRELWLRMSPFCPPAHPRILGVSEMFTDGYKALRAEFNMSADSADPWSDTLEWWFAIAETLTHHGIEVPDEWEFQDSPMHYDDERPEDYATFTVTEMLESGYVTESDLIQFGNVLTRYAGILKSNDCDY